MPGIQSQHLGGRAREIKSLKSTSATRPEGQQGLAETIFDVKIKTDKLSAYRFQGLEFSSQPSR